MIALGVLLGIAGGAATSSLVTLALVDIRQLDMLSFGVAAAYMIGVSLWLAG